MKKLWILYLFIGVLCFAGIFLIAAFSEKLDNTIKTFGFIILGYIGVSLFAYGWLKLFGKKNK